MKFNLESFLRFCAVCSALVFCVCFVTDCQKNEDTQREQTTRILAERGLTRSNNGWAPVGSVEKIK